MPQAGEWQLQEAKNRLSEVVRKARISPQTITLHGKPSAVILSFEEYRALIQPRKSLIELMRCAPKAFGELDFERSRETAVRELTL